MAIPVPTSLNLRRALDLTARMRATSGRRIELDCSGTGWVEPFGMVLVVCCADELRRAGRTVTAVNVPPDSYARHMGFFDNIDPNIAPPPSARRANEHYIAIVRKSRGWFDDESAAGGFDNAQDFIYEYAWSFATLLTQSTEECAVNSTLRFCLAEILRNMYEHSGSEQVVFCGQYWPTLSRVDFAVADQGIGLQAALSDNPFLEFDEENEARCDAVAIGMAMLPGVSGNSYEGAPRELDIDANWENSGYGLWMTSQISRGVGSFTICSGSSCFRFSAATTLSLGSAHCGTILGFSFDPAKVRPYGPSIQRIRSEGSAIERKLKGAIIDADAASKALRMKF